jgi:hypothetical protein
VSAEESTSVSNSSIEVPQAEDTMSLPNTTIEGQAMSSEGEEEPPPLPPWEDEPPPPPYLEDIEPPDWFVEGTGTYFEINDSEYLNITLTSSESVHFDASIVDPEAIVFAGAAPIRWTMEDVDGDGDLDLLLHFNTQDLNLDENSTEATLTGWTYIGTEIQGTDTVNIVP